MRKVVDALTECETWSRLVGEFDKKETVEVAQAAGQVRAVAEGEILTEEEKQQVIAKIQHIHRSTGHGSIHNLVKALEDRGCHPHVVRIAREWKCSVCDHRKRRDPRRFATLETIPQKWERVQLDFATWMHPRTKIKYHILVIIDEATRFRMARVTAEGKGNTTKWDNIREVLEQQWFSIFGWPQVLRTDSAGPWCSDEADRYCADKGIELIPIPGEAHWQASIVEGAIKSLKGMLETLSREFAEIEVTELLARSVWVCNSEEQYKGYTPIQQVLGRAPDSTGRLFESEDTRPIHPGLLDDGGFKEDVKMRCAATKAFAEEQAKRRLDKAERMGHRSQQQFLPGDLVYYWRQQVPAKERTTQQAGQFIGPARVLATETRRDPNQELRPGTIVWIHRGGRLLRAVPEQLRKASPYELQLEELRGPVELPWTITALATDPGRRTYIDISHEQPTDEQWEEAKDTPTKREHHGDLAPHKRHRSKLPVHPQGQKRQERETEETEGSSSSSRARREEDDMLAAFCACEDNLQAMEIAIDLPTSKRGLKRFFNNPEAYVCNMLKKRQVEVHEKRLSPEELKKFVEAKMTEVRNFLASECFELAKDKIPEEKKVVGMRWLLSWKYGDQYEGGKKAKARAIVLGYQDPRYSERQTAAPTPSRAGRQLYLQYCAWKGFKIEKGDISGAFLQGDLLDELWCRPLKEITDHLGIAEGTPMLMRRAAYGLVQAPLHWHQSINKYLTQQGYKQLTLEPCCWVWIDQSGEVQSIVHAHVDDFLFGGKQNNDIHQQLMSNIREAFKWGTWESHKFIQCGVEVSQLDDGSIELRQNQFISELEEIKITRERSRQTELPTTEAERSQLRGALGSLSWVTGQTCFIYAVDVNILLTQIPNSTVQVINTTNKLIRDIKKVKDQPYLIHAFAESEELELVGWSDAAHANRPNNVDSTE